MKRNEEKRITKRPVPGEHVGKVWDNVEGSVDDICYGQVHQEVVRHRPHSFIREHDPNH